MQCWSDLINSRADFAKTPTITKSAAPGTAAAERITMPKTKTNTKNNATNTKTNATTNINANANTNQPADFASLFIKGVERAAELQKKSLDDAARQNAEAIAVCKKTPQAVRAVPGVLDLAGQAFAGYIETQKSVIDHIVQQTAALVESAKDSGNSAQKVAADFTRTMQQSIERTVEVQKRALDLAAQESKAATASKRTA
jgi:hypothetical protein